jgi:hypothetical protein
MPIYALPHDGFVCREEILLRDPSNIFRETKFDIRARLKSLIEGFTDSRL